MDSKLLGRNISKSIVDSMKKRRKIGLWNIYIHDLFLSINFFLQIDYIDIIILDGSFRRRKWIEIINSQFLSICSTSRAECWKNIAE